MAEDTGPQSDAADPMIGKVFNGRFSITEVIGTGGMGRVYKAIQAPLDRIVALKVLNPLYGGGRDPNFQRRFFLEASLTSKLRHPNTITVIDYGRADEDIFYIAMEYVEGQTLSQVLAANGALPWKRALQITSQICRSLREAHKLGIIHRDLKPANVMLLSEETDHDVVKVLDFGLVKSLESGAEAEITQAGMMLGSPLYMAPEQARQTSDARSDLYSLGVVLYQMLMGRPPFLSKESVDAIVKHMSQKPPPFSQVGAEHNVPPEVEAVVMRCLEKDPDKRFQSMEELLEALRNAARAAGASDVFSDPRTSMVSSFGSGERRAVTPVPEVESALILADERPRSRKLLMGAAFAASLLLGGAVMWWLTRPEQAPAVVNEAPAVTRTATPEVAEPAPVAAPKPVKFVIRSEPEGAKVLIGDRDVGTTPATWEQPRGEGGVAEATITLSLDGYQTATVTARGEGPEVAVSETLKKKPARRSNRPKNEQYKDDPYKDDPYQ